MAKRALIIEDDEAVARALEALCRKLGIETSVTKNGRDGLDQACKNAPDAVVLDLLLPGMDGFKIAEGLRAAGSRAALLVISGVYRDGKVARDLVVRHGADFLQKPLKLDEVSAWLDRRLDLRTAMPETPSPASSGRAAEPLHPAPPMSGMLATKPFAVLLMELSRAKASGTLDLVKGDARKRIFLHFGQVRFAQSNIKAENIGGMQVAEGTLSEESFRAAIEHAKTEGIGLPKALALQGDLTHDALLKAARRQVEEVCITALAWKEGAFRFAPGSTEHIQDARRDSLALLCGGYQRYVSAEAAKEQLAPLSSRTIGRSSDFDRSLFVLRSAFGGETLTPLVNGRLTVGELCERARPDDLPLLAAMVQLGLAVVTPAEAGAQKAPAVRGSGPPRSHTSEEEAARSLILSEHERVREAPDLFAVLRLPRGATIEEVKSAYRVCAKRFHADAFAGLELDEASGVLTELFASFSQAHAVLADPRRRADYELLLERQEAGLPTSVEVIFKAEAAFDRGDALVKQGRIVDAEMAFKEALKLDPSVAQYHVALAQAILKGRGAVGLPEAHKILSKALALSPENPEARLLMAQVLDQEGDPKAALKLIDEVLAADPMSVEAGRVYRALKERMKKSGQSKGLLDKLLKH